jgi:hypothetical protein
MDELEESADFLRVCGDFFQDTHSVRIKNAFALTFVDFLEPVAAVPVFTVDQRCDSLSNTAGCHRGSQFADVDEDD